MTRRFAASKMKFAENPCSFESVWSGLTAYSAEKKVKCKLLEILRDQVSSNLPSNKYSISAFWVCSLFSASSHTIDCGPSMTSAATSSPR